MNRNKQYPCLYDSKPLWHPPPPLTERYVKQKYIASTFRLWMDLVNYFIVDMLS